MKDTEKIEYIDFSKSTLRTVNPSLAPKNSIFLGLNLDSDVMIGGLVSRKGTDILGVQMVDNGECFGLHHHFEEAGNVLFGVFSDGVNNDIYLASSGSKSLQNDTAGQKTRFLTYLGATVRVNGIDICKSYNYAGGWITTGGAFNLEAMPIGSLVVEWKDRVFTAGGLVGSGIIKYSSIADPDTKAVSWITDNGQIQVEQEDNGGDIAALAKVPGYLLMFKKRTIKRWDGSSTFPEDLIRQGVYSQECVCQGKEMVLFINTKGIWATNGGYPVRISKAIQDFIDNIPGDRWPDVSCWSDDEHAYFSIGNITIDNNDFTNVVLKYNVGQESWDIRSYYNSFRVFGQYVNTDGLPQIAVGDDDGRILILNYGDTDYESTPVPITYSLESQDLEFTSRGLKKIINSTNIFTENISSGSVLVRTNSHLDKDWKSFGKIHSQIEEIKDTKIEGNYFNIKITGTTDSGRVKILGYEFPKNSVSIIDNVK